MRKLIPRNDHVKNKDRQDPSAVLTLFDSQLTKYLASVGYVTHTIIPELDKYTTENQDGMFLLPVSVSILKQGWILFLCLKCDSGLASLYKARLHSPVDNIKLIKQNVRATNIHSIGSVVFLFYTEGAVVVIESDEKFIHLNPQKI